MRFIYYGGSVEFFSCFTASDPHGLGIWRKRSCGAACAALKGSPNGGPLFRMGRPVDGAAADHHRLSCSGFSPAQIFRLVSVFRFS